MPETPETASPAEDPTLRLKTGVLVIASPDRIPEAAFSVPAVRALCAAHPRVTIVILANAATAFLWRKMAEVNRVIEISASDSHRKLARQLTETKIPFQASIVWEDSPAARAFAKIEIAQRLGCPSDKSAKYLTHPVKVERKIGPIEHRVQHYLLFVREIGADPFQARHFASPPRPPAPEKARLALVPGSDFGTAAEWPLDRYQELARKLAPKLDLFILPSPGRPEPAAELAQSLDLPVTDHQEEDLIDFLGTCRAVIANDGTIPHLASFVGTPSLVIFGPNEPQWQRPLGRIHRILREHVPCSACLLPKCPLDHRCMTEITALRVFNNFKALLKKT